MRIEYDRGKEDKIVAIASNGKKEAEKWKESLEAESQGPNAFSISVPWESPNRNVDANSHPAIFRQEFRFRDGIHGISGESRRGKIAAILPGNHHSLPSGEEQEGKIRPSEGRGNFRKFLLR